MMNTNRKEAADRSAIKSGNCAFSESNCAIIPLNCAIFLKIAQFSPFEAPPLPSSIPTRNKPGKKRFYHPVGFRLSSFFLILFFVLTSNFHAQTFTPSGVRVTGPIVPGAPNKRTFQSPNGQFRLEIDSGVIATSPMRAMGTAVISSRSGQTWNIQWQTKVNSSDPSAWPDNDVIVSNDGSFFVVPYSPSEWRVHYKSDEKSRLLEGRSNVALESFFSSYAEPIFEADIFNGEPIARIWDRESDRWQGFFLKRTGEVSATDKDQARWNEATRKRIIGLLERSQKESMRQKLTGVSRAVASFAMIGIKQVAPGELRQTHLEFLALRRNPADRRWFENLLQSDEDSWKGAMTIGGRLWRIRQGRGDPYFFRNENSARSIADTLLAVFDQKISKKSPGGARTNDFFYLGNLSGKINLPTPILKNAGFMRIYVKPAGKTTATTPTALIQEEMTVATNDELDLTDQIAFAFNGLPAGSYLIKAVWDKRAPVTFSDTAGAGDYESLWIGPFQLAARGSFSNIVLNCTNQVPGVETYYAADAARARQWKTTSDLSVYSFAPWPASGFSSPIQNWIIPTNPPSSFPIYRINLAGDKLAANSLLNSRQQPLILLARPGPNVWQDTQFSILDEHGCVFPATRIEHREHYSAIIFAAFPRSADSFRLVITKTNSEAIAVDLTLTNLVRTSPFKFEPKTLPLQIDLGKVKMVVNKVIQDQHHTWMEATYTEDGQPTESWRSPGIFINDAHGNLLTAGPLCQHEKAYRIHGRIES